ncbi:MULTISPECIES: hypothetical protein [unclassified Roseitalea]|uniref:hypothetical protein n=1 Tax=unclassified Roseitalea TaxID=2639107 RepID=UPI00320A7A71
MSSLIRLVVVLAILAGLVYAGMFALVRYVEPNTREMTTRLPASIIDPVPAPMPRTLPLQDGPGEGADDAPDDAVTGATDDP